jgi:hypothetical protein
MNRREPAVRPTPQPLNDVPVELLTLLRQGAARRDTGLLILGGCPIGGGWRRPLLVEALAATAPVGPAAEVRAAHPVEGVDEGRQEQASGNGHDLARAPFGPPLPVFESAATALERGYRRIVIECQNPPNGGQRDALVSDPGGLVCVIACVPGFDARSAFVSLTRADWDALEGLLGVLSWVRLPGAHGSFTLCDAFTPSRRLVYRSRYADATDALYAGRQLSWEAQAVGHLEAGRVEPWRLRQQLLAWGLLEPGETEVMRETHREQDLHVALRCWLQERLLLRQKTGRYH